jgi:phage terminase large subunit
MRIEIDRAVPRWALPLHERKRYKGAKGGRGGGKSHEFAAMAVEEMVCDPQLRFVCIREVQRSLRYSAKSLVESKIKALGVEAHFDVLQTEIRRRGGTGVMIFEGMQDHTADSIKSLENFGRAWVEEAQSISKRSLDLLLPTIRAKGSEVWFSWNPEMPEDPVDQLFQGLAGEAFPLGPGVVEGGNFTLIHANYTQNPFLAEEAPEALEEAERMRALDADAYEHIWLGGYNEKSDSKVLAGKYVQEDFTVPTVQHVTRHGDKVQKPVWDGPYLGADHGFAMDPRTLVKCWIGAHGSWGPRCLYIERESYHVRLDIDRTANKWHEDVPGFADYVVRAEGAEPGTNNYLRRNGVPKIEDVKKWAGSVEDGIAFLRSFDKIVIHSDCPHAYDEARLYSYKVDKHTGDIKPDIEDKHNHIWDAVRYALAPFIKPGPRAAWISR